MKWYTGAILIVMGLCWAAFSGTCTVNSAIGEPGEPTELRVAVAVVTAISAIIGLGVTWVGVTMVRNSRRK